MVRALLAGRKTQTRRIMKPQPSAYIPGPNRHPTIRTEPYFDSYCNGPASPANPRRMSQHWCWWAPDNRQGSDWIRCPYGVPGDRLYVRETWKPHSTFAGMKPRDVPKSRIFYQADDTYAPSNTPWKPGIHMPRWASRLTLEITDVRAERLQAISEADAEAEGVEHPGVKDVVPPGAWWSPRDGYARLWEYINGPGSWDANPWVWAVSFKVIPAASDKLDGYGAEGGVNKGDST
ncbi:MAG: hypothetical protein ACK4FB_07890 [Brevundimonas sp.]|uniref:hypothetical protein n=1 Tax=Brevundimonas sp. TaxID=1871086 RepID=UPI00391BEF61